jgi:HEAT repeat protein
MALNPIARRQWAEDERVMPSFFTHWQKIRAVERRAASMSAEEQAQTAAELTRLIREDSNIPLRLAAVKALSAFPPEVAREGIYAAAADENVELRLAACQALRRLGDNTSINLLASLAQSDPALDVRLTATRQLAGVSHPAAMQALEAALEDRDPALQYRAMESLAVTTGKRYGYQVALWRAYLRGEEPPEPPTRGIAGWFGPLLR